jgi:hypothetical protein
MSSSVPSDHPCHKCGRRFPTTTSFIGHLFTGPCPSDNGGTTTPRDEPSPEQSDHQHFADRDAIEAAIAAARRLQDVQDALRGLEQRLRDVEAENRSLARRVLSLESRGRRQPASHPPSGGSARGDERRIRKLERAERAPVLGGPPPAY